MSRKTNSENNLEARFPELAKEWDIEKNPLRPDQVFPGTIIKYWWLCKNGHSYQSAPNKRTSSNRGCPYCSGRLVSKTNSLITLFPSIAKEFNSEKNLGIDVKELTIKSHKNIWWKYKKGHEWQSIISNRTRGNNCPFCNSQVSKNELRIYSELKYFFQKIGLKKKINGFECDILLPDLKVAIEYDGVYWHKDKAITDKKKNVGLLASGIYLIRVRELGLQKISNNDIIYDHNKKPILVAIKTILELFVQKKWLSKKSEEQIHNYIKHEDYVNDQEYRELLERLPSPIIEDSLEFKFPKLIEEWNENKNKGLLPSDVSSKSSLKVWWKCKQGHEWETSVGQRAKLNSGCPFCSGLRATKDNCLQTNYPKIAEEWNYKKNETITPNDITKKSAKLVWWLCKNGHEWTAKVKDRVAGRYKCSECRKKTNA